MAMRFPADHAGMALLRNRNFALLLTGQGVSRLGDGLYVAVVSWLAWSVTHAVGAVAVVTIAANAPTFVMTLIGASYADRYDRRRLMIGTDLARGALVGVAALLLALGLLHFALLVAVAAVLAAIGAPFAPARDALVARISPAATLVTANGLLQVSFRSAFFVGPLLLAPLLAIAPMPVVLTLDALTFAVSAVTLTAIDLPPASPARARPSLRDDLGAGLAVLRREPDVLLVIATFVLALAAASGFLTVGVIALVGHRLGGHAGEYGLLIGIAGVAEVFGALVVARLHLRNLARTAVLAWVLLGAFRFPLGLATNALLAAGLLAVTGFASALTDIPLIALIQQRIPDRHLAKALGLWEAGIAGAIAIAPVIATTLIDNVGVSTGFMLSGAALIVIGTTAALALNHTRSPDAVSSPASGHTRANPLPPATSPARTHLRQRCTGLRSQPVEAQQSRLDGEDFQASEAGFQGVPVQRGGSHHGSGRGGIRVAHDRRQACDHAPGVVVLLLDGSRGGELLLDELVGDDDAARFPEHPACHAQRIRRAGHIVQPLDDRHQVVLAGHTGAGRVSDGERDTVRQVGLLRIAPGRLDRVCVQVEAVDADQRVRLRHGDAGPARSAGQVRHPCGRLAA
jgi:MFS family permease